MGMTVSGSSLLLWALHLSTLARWLQPSLMPVFQAERIGRHGAEITGGPGSVSEGGQGPPVGGAGEGGQPVLQVGEGWLRLPAPHILSLATYLAPHFRQRLFPTSASFTRATLTSRSLQRAKPGETLFLAVTWQDCGPRGGRALSPSGEGTAVSEPPYCVDKASPGHPSRPLPCSSLHRLQPRPLSPAGDTPVSTRGWQG